MPGLQNATTYLPPAIAEAVYHVVTLIGGERHHTRCILHVPRDPTYRDLNCVVLEWPRPRHVAATTLV